MSRHLVVAEDTSRLPVIDAVRGIALLGVFLVNLGAFTGYASMTPDERASLPTASADGPVVFVLLCFVMGKFYSLFSLLFGLGFALQMDGAARQGDAGLGRFRRRLLVLLGIGGLHLVFWEGDILTLYASLGFALLLCRDWPARRLVGGAAVLIAAPVLLATLVYATNGLLDPGAPLQTLATRADAALGFPQGSRPVDVLAAASWGTYLRYQLPGPLYRYADLLSTGRPFKVFAMFLLGLAVGRSGMVRDIATWAPTLRRIRNVGFAIGLPGSAAYAAMFVLRAPGDSPLKILEAAAYAAGIAPLALGYAATLLLSWQQEAWRRRLVRFAPAGRMALTNYLTQTAVAVLAFYGVGLGLMGRVGPVLWIAFGVLVFSGQTRWSRWWLERFRYGPVEWIWRQATHGQRLPLRRTASPSGATTM